MFGDHWLEVCSHLDVLLRLPREMIAAEVNQALTLMRGQEAPQVDLDKGDRAFI